MDSEKWAIEAEARTLKFVADTLAVETAAIRADLDQRHAALAEMKAAVFEVYADAEAALNAEERELLTADLRRLRHERDALRAEIRVLGSRPRRRP